MEKHDLGAGRNLWRLDRVTLFNDGPRVWGGRRNTSMTEQMKAATIRGLYGAFWTAGSVFFVTFQVSVGDRATRLEDSAIAAAASFFAYMVSRGMAEGLIDSNRGPTSADVGQPWP